MAGDIPIAVFVTPHGYGHAARAAAVLESLADQLPGVRPEIFTTVPRWFFAESLAERFGYHECACDLGLVQASSLEEDVPATIARLRELVPFHDSVVSDLAERVRRLGCRVVLCDVAPLGIVVAARAGVPSVLVESFTWDWIYRAYQDEHPELGPIRAYLARLAAAATVHIQTEPACAPNAAAIPVPPVSRRPRRSRAEVRAALGIEAAAPAVLVTMGGIPWSFAGLDAIAERTMATLVIPGASAAPAVRGPLILLPHRSGHYHPDLVHAVDAVIGKLGYSTVAEASHAGIPLGYVMRRRFPESPVLAGFVDQRLPSLRLAAADFASGRWVERLRELLRRPQTAPVANGAAAAADHVASLLR
jgi:hypothetical protein